MASLTEGIRGYPRDIGWGPRGGQLKELLVSPHVCRLTSYIDGHVSYNFHLLAVCIGLHACEGIVLSRAEVRVVCSHHKHHAGSHKVSVFNYSKMMKVHPILTAVPRRMAGSLASGAMPIYYRHSSAHARAGLRQLLGWPTVESSKPDAAQHSMTAGKA